MRHMSREYVLVLSALVGALAIIATAWWTNGADDYEDAWLYVFCIWLILNSALDVYLRRKKDTDK